MNYKNYNDYELIYMVRESDDDSQSILYQKYLPIIKNIASEYYNRFKEYGYDYDDFLQEAMVAFQKSISSYNEEKDVLFYTFTSVCMRRSLMSFCRNISNSKKNISSSSLVDLEEYAIKDEKNDINSIFQDYEIQAIFKDVIYSLSFEEGAILELKLNGFTYREISTLLGIPSSSVEFKSRKARDKIRSSLKKYYCN